MLTASLAALAIRIAIYQFGFVNPMVALVLLPARADLIVFGVLAAIAVGRSDVPWPQFMPVLRFVPAVTLTIAVWFSWLADRLFSIYGPLLMAVGCAAYLLAVYLDAPEAARLKSPLLRFFGNNGYCLYLTHLPVLGLMHGIFLGAPPDLATPAQWLVTLAALPVCVLVGWGMTRLVEEPLTTFGRRWRWSVARRGGGYRRA